jgi:Disulphide bond corrector protein DsbC
MWVRYCAGALFAVGVRAAQGAPVLPVHWRVKSAPTKMVKGGAKFSVTIEGQIDPGWHLYALEEPQGGPMATEVALTEGDPADLLLVEEGKPKVLPDPLFQQPTRFFEGTAEFTLHLQMAKSVSDRPTLHILLRYQSCNDRICLPPHTDTMEVPLGVGR